VGTDEDVDGERCSMVERLSSAVATPIALEASVESASLFMRTDASALVLVLP